MPKKDAKCQKDRRERIKREKEEIRRLAIVRGNESRKRRRIDPELHTAEFEVEVTAPMDMEEEKKRSRRQVGRR